MDYLVSTPEEREQVTRELLRRYENTLHQLSLQLRIAKEITKNKTDEERFSKECQNVMKTIDFLKVELSLGDES